MNRWEVTLVVGTKLVKHVVKATDSDSAFAKAMRAHLNPIPVNATNIGILVAA